MRVEIHLYTQSKPVIVEDAKNTYQKGDMFCVMHVDGKTVDKFPLQHVFRVREKED